ncbi:unnamed protein product [Meloidogyne enterolobii]|uniref:Uncharacterized protein n=1 Tax=Meloidogyne enterolobii TaxID=390850 RepID=A0ACB0YQL2_MELEN
MTTLLITPTLNSTNQVATSFALHLLKTGRSTNENRQLFALVSPKDGTKISKSLELYFEGGQLNILYGSAGSQKIVKRVVEVNEIRAVFVIIDDESIADEENIQGLKSHFIASKTHSFLTSLCSLLDCLRQTNVIPSIVVLFHSFGTVKEEFLLPHLGIFYYFINLCLCFPICVYAYGEHHLSISPIRPNLFFAKFILC